MPCSAIRNVRYSETLTVSSLDGMNLTVVALPPERKTDRRKRIVFDPQLSFGLTQFQVTQPQLAQLHTYNYCTYDKDNDDNDGYDVSVMTMTTRRLIMLMTMVMN